MAHAGAASEAVSVRISPIALAVTLAAAPMSAQMLPHVVALEASNRDTTCAACTDFFQFANGGWLKRVTIPPSFAYYGAFEEVRDQNAVILRRILESNPSEKLATFYQSCMDTAARNQRDLTALQPEFDVITGIKTKDDLVRAFATLEHLQGLAPWGSGPQQDERNATVVIAVLEQGGITLPNRDYYVKDDSDSKRIRAGYRQHLVVMFRLLGDGPARSDSEASVVVALETKLAQASRSAVAAQDPQTNHHDMTVAALDSLTPHLRWSSFFRAQGASNVGVVDVAQPEFFTTLDSLVTSEPIDHWKTLLRWRALSQDVYDLSAPFRVEHFHLKQLFTGAPVDDPLWKTCVASTNQRLGDLLGQAYVRQAFTPAAKVRAVRIVTNLVDALRARIEGLDWMSAETKAQALAKLGAMGQKIGYPEKWKDYAGVTVVRGDYLANALSADQWASARNWRKVGKPVDRSEWALTPPTVDAYYNPRLNEIVFPAGILQPPFYNPDADDAVNYGSMGAVIGHEMTHDFDNRGRQYDKDGNLRDWWMPADSAKFNAEARKVVRQFASYTAVDGATHVNGELTLGEDIADLGGVTIGYAAMEKELGDGPRQRIDGFTPEQRFFLGWAQMWRQIMRPEFERMIVKTDVHPPAKWRVNGPLSDMPEFQAAWGCAATDSMVRAAADRPRIW
jgi:putative endopeptidase